mmetsp:Transcript_28114/g.61379  ORF Transcript_28114/g.61379 Transcript_28114/m.61379 type:complete len:82 (+) Transcript_28114:1461-1706(+)
MRQSWFTRSHRCQRRPRRKSSSGGADPAAFAKMPRLIGIAVIFPDGGLAAPREGHDPEGLSQWDAFGSYLRITQQILHKRD